MNYTAISFIHNQGGLSKLFSNSLTRDNYFALQCLDKISDFLSPEENLPEKSISAFYKTRQDILSDVLRKILADNDISISDEDLSRILEENI